MLGYSFSWVFLLLKIGLPPFHFWFLQLLKNIRWKNLTIFLSIYKIPPILFLFSERRMRRSFFILGFYSHLLIRINYKIKYLFFISSAANRFWILLLREYSYFLALLYFSIYIGILLNSIYWRRPDLLLPFFIFIGLPPFPLFYLKYLFLSFRKISLIVWGVLLIFFLLSLLRYFRVVLSFLTRPDKYEQVLSWSGVSCILLLRCGFYSL